MGDGLEMLRCLFGDCFGPIEVVDCQSIPCGLDCFHFLTLQLGVELAVRGWRIGDAGDFVSPRLEAVSSKNPWAELYGPQPWLLPGHRGLPLRPFDPRDASEPDLSRALLEGGLDPERVVAALLLLSGLGGRVRPFSRARPPSPGYAGVTVPVLSQAQKQLQEQAPE